MVHPIVRYGDPVLRQKGKAIPKVTDEIRKLVDDMLETMNHAEGVGLAAQQIGKALQLAVVDVTQVTKRESRMWIKDEAVDPLAYMPLILINPKLELTKKKVMGNEGCLSFPGLGFDVPRSIRVKVSTQTLEGKVLEFEAGGLLGRAIQHEYDHLQGKLFIDHLDAEGKKEIKGDLDLLLQGKEIPQRD
jgi:peptide deformylase